MDSFLAAHKHEDINVFDLSWPFATISIRDQATRAAVLADRLPAWLQGDEGFPDGRPYRVLVIGGGVCGLSVAASLSVQTVVPVEVTVLEGSPNLFGVQRTCRTRWIDATQYDWPAPHWRSGDFPQPRRTAVRRHHVAFPWTADYADRIVSRQWSLRLSHDYAVLRGRILYSTTYADGPDPFLINTQGLVEVGLEKVQTGGKRKPLGTFDYHAVVLATGPGREQCSFDTPVPFVGRRFWDTDDLQSPACGKNAEVVLSGTGDGALQDLIRVVTRQRSAKAVWDTLGLGTLPMDLTRLTHLEADVERTRGWSSPDDVIKPYLDALHAEYARLVDALFRADKALAGRVAAVAGQSPAVTHLVCTRSHFVCDYPLNRLVALVLIRGLAGKIVTHDGYRVSTLTPTKPTPPTAVGCAAVPWTVGLTHATQPPRTIAAAVVVLRHGLIRTPDSPRPTLPHLPTTLY